MTGGEKRILQDKRRRPAQRADRARAPRHRSEPDLHPKGSGSPCAAPRRSGPCSLLNSGDTVPAEPCAQHTRERHRELLAPCGPPDGPAAGTTPPRPAGGARASESPSDPAARRSRRRASSYFSLAEPCGPCWVLCCRVSTCAGLVSDSERPARTRSRLCTHRTCRPASRDVALMRCVSGSTPTAQVSGCRG